MKFISWNVNGLRACVGKGFEESFNALDADFFCLQETKMQAGQLDLQFDGYRSYWNYAEKKGYSGTAIYTRHEPLSAAYGIGIADHDTEGRVITLEYDTFYLVTVYVPNSQDGLRRLDYRMSWEDDFRAYLKGLDSKKPVVVCGDMNVAHREIDLKNPKTNRRNAGFTDEERGKMTELLNAGFTDTFRPPIPTRPTYIRGGRIASMPARRTQGGASTISSRRRASTTNCKMQKYTPRFSAQTIVPWRSTLICRQMVKNRPACNPELQAALFYNNAAVSDSARRS
mgnify:CR=1 FL=1